MNEHAAAPAAGAEQREYRVGDRIYEVKAFKGSKGVRAFAIVSRVLRDRFRPIWEADAKFQADYRELNALRITRGMAHYRVEQAQAAIAALEAEAEATQAKREMPPDEIPLEQHRQQSDREVEAIGHLIKAQEINRDQWSRMLAGALSQEPEVVVPQNPDDGLRLAHAFPLLWDVAEVEMTMLLGLALIPEDELQRARQDGGPEGADKAVQDLGADALDHLELDEVADLMLSVAEVASARLRARGGGLGNRVAALREAWGGRHETAATEKDPEPTETPRPGTFVGYEDEPPETGSESSSTDSPAGTGGAASEPSMASSGATS